MTLLSHTVKALVMNLAELMLQLRRLNDIQSQLAQSVEITESIKKDIEQGAWRERGVRAIKEGEA